MSIDSAQAVNVKLTQQTSRLQTALNEVNQSYSNCQRLNNTLEKENEQLKQAAQEKTKSTTKAKTVSSKATTKSPALNPFGNGGSGNVAGNGNRTEPFLEGQSGPGNGAPNNRYLIQKPDTRDIQCDETCELAFIVTVNELGEIVGEPILDKSGTTTTDSVLIKKVLTLVKEQTKYSPMKGAGNLKKTIRVKLNAG